jgi:hypothetical protein
MKSYSLAVAWNWEFDDDYVGLIEKECGLRNISLLNITPSYLGEICSEIMGGTITALSFYDRASDDDEAFFPLAGLMKEKKIPVINPYENVDRAKDKATMHLELITAGLQVPYTVIISPYNKDQDIELDQQKIERLGKSFIIKPANTTGGGTGVMLQAESVRDIIESRKRHKDDKYLLQEYIYPVILGEKRAWFRAFYAFGEVVNCWWDDHTHIYKQCSQEEEELYGLSELREMMLKIQNVCNLDFFSSEIALTSSGKFVVIDYVNEICDMRLQSKFIDGVPDAVVEKIAGLLADFVYRKTSAAEV